jgi:hypothetical protein
MLEGRVVDVRQIKGRFGAGMLPADLGLEGTALANQDLALWDRVEDLVDRAPSWRALQLHRLHLVAARLRSRRGEEIPPHIADEARRRAILALTARTVLERVRDAYDGGLLLMKGLEVASLYPHPKDRPFRDLDILAEDPEDAQTRLISAGFVEFGDRAPHHLRRLVWPDVPVLIELHSRPKTPEWVPELSAAMVFSRATASRTSIAGLLAPDPAAHALLLAAHGWAHDPLRRLGDVIDIAAVLRHADRSTTSVLAREWGLDQLWNATVAVTDGVITERALPRRLSPWTRHLLHVRDRRVVEHQLSLLVAPAFTIPASQAPRGLARGVGHIVARRNGEPWAHKIRRSRRALLDALKDESLHELHASETEAPGRAASAQRRTDTPDR